MTNDPYFEELQSVLGQIEISAKIASTTVWDILDVRPGQRTQDQNRRMGEAMRALGWRRPNKAGLVKLEGKTVMGYVKGDPPWHVELTLEVLFPKDR